MLLIALDDLSSARHPRCQARPFRAPAVTLHLTAANTPLHFAARVTATLRCILALAART
jgi:hypothetical protein